jgi:hypothetical protein
MEGDGLMGASDKIGAAFPEKGRKAAQIVGYAKARAGGEQSPQPAWFIRIVFFVQLR